MVKFIDLRIDTSYLYLHPLGKGLCIIHDIDVHKDCIFLKVIKKDNTEKQFHINEANYTEHMSMHLFEQTEE